MADVGKRLHAVRTQRGLSQRELAKRAGVTNSTISLIEQNRVSPSVGSLKKVLDGLPMSLAEFFAMGADEGKDDVLFPASEQPDVGQGEMHYFLVGAGRRNRSMAVLREVMGPGADTGEDRLEHDGEEAGVVLRGRVELTVGEQVCLLGPGDGYYFNSRQPHRFRNPGDQDAELVSVSSPPLF